MGHGLNLTPRGRELRDLRIGCRVHLRDCLRDPNISSIVRCVREVHWGHLSSALGPCGHSITVMYSFEGRNASDAFETRWGASLGQDDFEQLCRRRNDPAMAAAELTLAIEKAALSTGALVQSDCQTVSSMSPVHVEKP